MLLSVSRRGGDGPTMRRTLCTDTHGASMAKLLVLHGPNLNMLGVREPTHYGHASLDEINAHLQTVAQRHGATLACFQSNAEYQLIDRVHAALNDGTDFIVINPAGLTHTSVPLRDALLSVGIPFVEVHLSNIHKREPFRHHSYFSDAAEGVICGLGPSGYEAALNFAIERLNEPERT